jgi:hypothetical protein
MVRLMVPLNLVLRLNLSSRPKTKLDVGAEVELETALVKGTEELRLLDSWYKLSPLGPPQISVLFAAHAILPTV